MGIINLNDGPLELYKHIQKNFMVIKEIHNQLTIKHLILPAHIILTLFYVYSNDSGSRYTITDTLAIPISRVRKILDSLEQEKLLEKNVGRKGTVLTSEGFKFCEALFSLLKIANPLDPIDLGEIVLGKVNSLTMMPRFFFTKNIKPISIRDSSLKCGALGASIFETNLDENGNLIVKFLDGEIIESKKLTGIIKGLVPNNEHQLIIASTVNELSQFFFNPLFDSKKVNSFKIVLLASVQSMWEIIDHELN